MSLVSLAPVRAVPAARNRRDPAWARPAFVVLLAATTVLYVGGLGASQWANAFYSAAVQAGAHSWKAFFFGSSDAANLITVDKTPLALWPMDLTARVFGVNSWSILLPQALMGVATVALLYATVRRSLRPLGPGVAVGGALLAGAALATTPVAALMFRYNNPDALLVLLLTAGTYALLRAQERASTAWLVVAGSCVGLGFSAKMLQAFLVLPAFGLVYLVMAPTSLRRRLWQLAVALGTLLVSAGWWVAIVAAVPANSRPYIGGSQHNSVLELALGYNGLGRLNGEETGGLGNTNQDAGWTRMFGPELGGQIAWLLPAALLLLTAGVWTLATTRRRTASSRNADAVRTGHPPATAAGVQTDRGRTGLRPEGSGTSDGLSGRSSAAADHPDLAARVSASGRPGPRPEDASGSDDPEPGTRIPASDRPAPRPEEADTSDDPSGRSPATADHPDLAAPSGRPAPRSEDASGSDDPEPGARIPASDRPAPRPEEADTSDGPSGRRPSPAGLRADGGLAAFCVWGGWMLVTGAVFSLMQGIFHGYYTVALAPPIAALAGTGGAVLWARRQSPVAVGALAAAVALTAWWSYRLLGRTPDFAPWLRLPVLAGGLLAAAALFAGWWLGRGPASEADPASGGTWSNGDSPAFSTHAGHDDASDGSRSARASSGGARSDRALPEASPGDGTEHVASEVAADEEAPDSPARRMWPSGATPSDQVAFGQEPGVFGRSPSRHGTSARPAPGRPAPGRPASGRTPGRRIAVAGVLVAAGVSLAGPAAYAVETAATPHNGAIPSAGPAGMGGPGGMRGPGGFPGGRRGTPNGTQGGQGGFPGAGGIPQPPNGTGGTPPGHNPGGGTAGNGTPSSGTPGGGTPSGGATGSGTPGNNPGGVPGGGAVGNGAAGGGAAGGFGGGWMRRGGMGGPGALLDAPAPGADLTALLRQNVGAYTWAAATVGSNSAAGYQLASGAPVMALGGFNGTDPAPTLARFQQYVREKKVHYFISTSSPMGARGGSGSDDAQQIAAWVTTTYPAKTVDGTTVYDLG